MARKKQQRSEETTARLLDACIDTIAEVGYARASAAVVAKRANMSDGSVFRHFTTMGDFMAATANEVMRRQLELFTKRVAEIAADGAGLDATVTILRDVTANSTNAVLYELLIAARTDEKLNAALRVVLAGYTAKIHEIARALPGVEHLSPAELATVVAVLNNAFDGAAIVRAVVPQPELEDSRIALLSGVLSNAIDSAQNDPGV